MNTVSSTLSAVQTYAQNLLPNLKIDQETINKASKTAINVIQSIGAAIGIAAVAMAKIYSSLDPKTATTLLSVGGFALAVFILSRPLTGEREHPTCDRWAQKMSRDDRESESYKAEKAANVKKADALSDDSLSMHGGDHSNYVKVRTRT
jgi:hypothetical protein